ncbi:MAG: nucleoside hydrolase [Acidimicrobiia bacterium]
MVVDTDLASDDVVALFYLVSDPRVDLRAVTVSGTGEVTCPRGAAVARGLLTSMGKGDVPVACGQSAPLSGDRVFPAEWRTAADNAYGLVLPIVAAPADEQDAVELLIGSISAAEAPVTLLTLGPLTNVAQALAEEPDLVDDLASVVVMGGAVDVPGNVQPEGAAAPLAAEWNLYIDPAASAAVVDSGAPVTLVSLDATNQVPVTEGLIDRLAANDRTDATSHVLDILSSRTPPYLWDPLAAIAATDPVLVPSHEVTIAVTIDGDDAGRTVEQPGGSAVLVADPPDVDTVLDHLLRTLAGMAEDEPLTPPTTIPIVGNATVGFDGATCTYDGPTSLPPGSLVVTATPGPVPYYALVAHLVEGATIEDAVAWAAEHPDEQPPMIDRIDAVGEDAMPSPATIELMTGTSAVVCGTTEGALALGATVTVGG